MTKFLIDASIDAALNYIRDNVNLMVATEGYPASYAEAIDNKGTGTGKTLARVAMAPVDFTIANGDVSGRKITVANKTAVPIDVTGNADHIALLNTTGTAIIAVLENDEVDALVSGNDVNFLSNKLEIADIA